jgi:hypothetical protein
MTPWEQRTVRESASNSRKRLTLASLWTTAVALPYKAGSTYRGSSFIHSASCVATNMARPAGPRISTTSEAPSLQGKRRISARREGGVGVCSRVGSKVLVEGVLDGLAVGHHHASKLVQVAHARLERGVLVGEEGLLLDGKRAVEVGDGCGVGRHG